MCLFLQGYVNFLNKGGLIAHKESHYFAGFFARVGKIRNPRPDFLLIGPNRLSPPPLGLLALQLHSLLPQFPSHSIPHRFLSSTSSNASHSILYKQKTTLPAKPTSPLRNTKSFPAKAFYAYETPVYQFRLMEKTRAGHSASSQHRVRPSSLVQGTRLPSPLPILRILMQPPRLLPLPLLQCTGMTQGLGPCQQILLTHDQCSSHLHPSKLGPLAPESLHSHSRRCLRSLVQCHSLKSFMTP